MLHLAKDALTSEFLLSTPNGLLLIFDEAKETTYLGWIERAELQGARLTFVLGLTVTQNHNTRSKWEQLNVHAFRIPDVGRYTALDHVGGFHCTEDRMKEPTFKVYPAVSIPGDLNRNYESLISYGEMLR